MAMTNSRRNYLMHFRIICGYLEVTYKGLCWYTPLIFREFSHIFEVLMKIHENYSYNSLIRLNGSSALS